LNKGSCPLRTKFKEIKIMNTTKTINAYAVLETGGEFEPLS
jgi:hypothetical protein